MISVHSNRDRIKPVADEESLLREASAAALRPSRLKKLERGQAGVAYSVASGRQSYYSNSELSMGLVDPWVGLR